MSRLLAERHGEVHTVPASQLTDLRCSAEIASCRSSVSREQGNKCFKTGSRRLEEKGKVKWMQTKTSRAIPTRGEQTGEAS